MDILKCREVEENIYYRGKMLLCFQALTKHHVDLRRHQQTGVHNEERFLEETAQREENYQASITELEAEIKIANAAKERLNSENERLLSNVNELTHQVKYSVFKF